MDTENKNEESLDKGEKNVNKKKKNGKLMIVLGILIILAGAGIIAYPFLSIYFHGRQTDELLEQAQSEINAAQSVTTTAELTTVTTSGNSDVQLTTASDDVQVATGTTVQTTTEKQNGDRLNGQTLIGIIEAPAIDLTYPVVEGAQKAQIDFAIGHMSGSADFGAKGNCALAGHRGGTSGQYFDDIGKLEKGDKVTLTNIDGDEFVYKVTESFSVEPTEVWVATDDLDNDGTITDDEKNGHWLTLITCQDNGSKRLVVRCSLIE